MLTLIDTPKILQQQRVFYVSGKTKELDFRVSQLKLLKQIILQQEAKITAALKADLNKPELEAYFEIIAVTQEIDYTLKHLKSWLKPKKISTPLSQFPASAQIYPEPLGVVLIISPWNYPFSLALSPLVGAIAAGNCAMIKPSELAPKTSEIIVNLIAENFEANYITAIAGGVEVSQQLLNEKFDHIFFTGGTNIGKIVMAAAAKHLTPVTLELGGKSPCIVDPEINLKETAKRITWGKFINAGQTCIAPDYLLVHPSIKAELITEIKTCIQEFYGENPVISPDYPRIISERHWQRLTNLLKDGTIVYGGETDANQKYIAPTLIDNISLDSPLMQEEIFGPILPILTYTELEEAIALINSRPKPLALYFFSQNQQKQEQILKSTSSGGVCINDTILQVGVTELPFGGVGDSGIGSYHGKASFDTFSHYKSVLRKPFWFELNWRYAPYQGKLAQLKRLFKT